MRVLATLNLTLATLSEAMLLTVGNIRRVAVSDPTASTKTWNAYKKNKLKNHERDHGPSVLIQP